jgi:hypothetical protein
MACPPCEDRSLTVAALPEIAGLTDESVCPTKRQAGRINNPPQVKNLPHEAMLLRIPLGQCIRYEFADVALQLGVRIAVDV